MKRPAEITLPREIAVICWRELQVRIRELNLLQDSLTAAGVYRDGIEDIAHLKANLQHTERALESRLWPADAPMEAP